ncbi:HAAS signaling domain-containing protein [Cellulomonas xiejunii]|uniref:Uncharacterized protein n=1 Tax=Cellulomonas xiejunii TaxID=2968083 RepID=A0ABY5KPF5_9CELL|nr:hypothetical protein [Cellulomonas xiejunii]MCC2319710.1 hypothetical protein [Cellulomonas xiejunii]UUI71351.1 hypothetical protein NP048_16395 [Cellulomonas xiejunii]
MSTRPADLAPHVDRTWADAFVIELRLRDVPGDTIGDLLAEVESHVLDSGAPAHEAFGDPKQYAAQIAETTARPEADDRRGDLPIWMGCAAMIVAIDSAFGWWRDGTYALTGSTVVLVLGMVAILVVVERYGTSMLRFVLGAAPWKAGLLTVAAMAPLVGLGVLGRSWHIAVLPAAPVTLGALAVLAASTLFWLWLPRSLDPLLAPGADRAAADEGARREYRRFALRLAALQGGYVAAVLLIVFLVLRRTT